MKSLEKFCEVPFTEEDFRSIRMFVPHVGEERFELLKGFQVIFRDIFRSNKLSEEALGLLRDVPKLAKIFEGHEDLPRPKDGYQHYMLDRVLRGDVTNWKELLYENAIWPGKEAGKQFSYQLKSEEAAQYENTI